MKKENVVELANHRREQFYLSKQHLVEKIGYFLESKIFYQDYQQLKNEFSRRTKGFIQEDMQESFFVFWLFFYHRFDDGLRGVDWFNRDRAHSLDVKEKRMLDSWIHMKPRFLQLVRIEGNHAIFEDKDTKEQFPMSTHAENLAHAVPWLSTFAMVEEFDDVYYFNGFWMGVGPIQLRRAEIKVQEIMEETGLNRSDVFEKYFPEITVALLNRNWEIHGLEREVYEYNITYSIENSLYVTEFLRGQKDFKINKWEKNEKELVWAGNWRVYHDSECELPVKLADVFGTITVNEKDNSLTFETMQKECMEEMKERLSSLGNKLTLKDEIAKLVGTSTKESHNTMVSMDEEIPQYFALFAQDDLFYEVEQPIPMYDGRSLRELLAQGEIEKVETWLRNAEFVQYKQVLGKEEKVEVTANFNGIRKDMRLPLSPFVTGGEHRQTTIEPIELEDNGPRLMEEDIPYLEELGFAPETIDQFYIGDFIRFYKERTIGKSDNTRRKYRHSLHDLRAILETKTLFRWEQCNTDFWKIVVEKDYPELFDDGPGKTEQKAFINTLKMFLTWLEQMGKTENFTETINWIQNLEK